MSDFHGITTDKKIEKRATPTNIHLNVFKYGWYKWTSWRGFWSNIKNIPRVIKYAWQRAVRGYCDADLWDLDTTYTDYILATLIEFRNNTRSSPIHYTSWEEWIARLDWYIDRLIYLKQDSDELNSFSEEAYEIMCKPKEERTESEQHLMNNYYKAEEEIETTKRATEQKLFADLGKELHDLWW